MARLFTALFPTDEARSHQAGKLARVGGHEWSPCDTWHITLCFHGDDDDPATRLAWLRERAAELRPIRLRLASAGAFPGVLWIGVESDSALTEAAEAVRGHTDDHVERHGFKPHLTVARSRREPLDATPLMDYKGPWWTSRELVLVRSERTQDGYRHSPLDVVLLRGPE
ncbi:MAG: RNA 2',3'-cyclic phosphodiesterase [Kutzneria sp.]|nr:RNA 2',3'-cyclic phosphodiesterase [Kutzneria sp.]MBV9845427.1 RNA 2',3'-cyclic phosphodiesterase [Kutzneria sp.]